MYDFHQLLQQLQHGTPAQRQRAAHRLGSSKNPQVVQPLLEALASERSYHVRWVIVEALGHLGDAAALKPLDAILSDEREHGHVRFQSGLAIQRLTRQPISTPRFARPPQPWTPDLQAVSYTDDSLNGDHPDAPNSGSLTAEQVREYMQAQAAVLPTAPRLAGLRRLANRLIAIAANGQTHARAAERLEQWASPAKEPPNFWDLKRRIQQLAPELAILPVDPANKQQMRERIETAFNAILAEDHIALPRSKREKLLDFLVTEMAGLGPLESLLADEGISEIRVNGPKNVWIERTGSLTRANVVFESEEHLVRLIERILAPLGRRLDETTPYVDARLPDGSRVAVVSRPVSVGGPSLVIRKFPFRPLALPDLIRAGSMSREIAIFLHACMIARLNVIVSGGPGAGKTTLLNVLAGFIPNDEPIATLERVAELQLFHTQVLTLECSQANGSGKGEVTLEDLLKIATRMQPDRLVIGTIAGSEALHVLGAMIGGFPGSLATLHSNSPQHTLLRLEQMCRLGDSKLSPAAIRELIASAVDLIIHVERLRDGSRKIVRITEVAEMDGDEIVTSDLFEFEQLGNEDGKIIGRTRPLGVLPKCLSRIEEAGIALRPELFGLSPSVW